MSLCMTPPLTSRYGWITFSGDVELAGAKRSSAMYEHFLYTVGKPLQDQRLSDDSELFQVHPKVIRGTECSLRKSTRCKRCLMYMHEFSETMKRRGFHEAVCDFCLKHHVCNECCKEKPQDEFKPSAWKLRFSQKIVCRQCESTGKFCKVCGKGITVETHQCDVCKQHLREADYSTSMWHNRHTRRAVCQDCLRKGITVETHQCDVCQQHLREADYTNSMWKHRHTRRAVCNACLHPRCTNPQCKACQTCYNTKCKMKPGQCTKDFDGKLRIQSMLPETAEELAIWLCPTCIFTCCQVCRKEPAQATIRARRLKQRQLWTCA